MVVAGGILRRGAGAFVKVPKPNGPGPRLPEGSTRGKNQAKPYLRTERELVGTFHCQMRQSILASRLPGERCSGEEGLATDIADEDRVLGLGCGQLFPASA